jgi:hypothetical protein
MGRAPSPYARRPNAEQGDGTQKTVTPVPGVRHTPRTCTFKQRPSAEASSQCYAERVSSPLDGSLKPEDTTTLVPFPTPIELIPPTTRFRSTWVVSSLEGLRARGCFDRYEAQLIEHRDAILSAIAGVWLPVDVVRAHYEACEKLAISDTEYLLMVKTAPQVRQAWFSRMIAEAQHPQATPWTALRLMHRGWPRAADGGAVGVSRLADNRGRIDYVSCSLFEIPYFRRAVRLMIQFLVAHKTASAMVRDLPERKAHTCSYSVDWP